MGRRESAASPAPSPRASAGGRARLAGIALRAALLPLVLVLAEVGLALAGFDAPASRLPYQVVELPLFERRGGPEGAWYAAREERLGSAWFAASKAAGGRRVFCLGGSAMRGLGYSPNASLPGYLEDCLEAAGSGARWDVVNGGVVGLSSLQVKDMCADVLAHDPDVVVVCSGNNEFLDLHARRYRESRRSPLAGALADAVQSLRSYHFVRRVAGERAKAGPGSGGGLQLTASEIVERVRLSDEDVLRQLERYRANLAAICESCRRAGVPLVLVTVPANLRWNDPFPGADWVASVLRECGEDPRPGEGGADPDAGVRRALASVERDLPHATGASRFRLHYARAKCLEALGDVQGARAAYLASIAAEPHRRRTTAAMNDVVRETAAAGGARLFDAVAYLAELQTVPDERFFYDHIHFTPEGAATLAARLAELLGEWSLAGPRPAACDPAQALEALERRLELGEDSPDVERWIGFNFDPGLVPSEDLWKYDRAVEELRRSVRGPAAAGTGDTRRGKALTYLGNACSFEAGGAAEARRCYEEALTLVPQWEQAIRGNLAALERRPDGP